MCSSDLHVPGDWLVIIIFQKRVPELPAGCLEPAHDGGDAGRRIPSGVAENRDLRFAICNLRLVSLEMYFAGVRLQKNVIANKENAWSSGECDTAVASDALLRFGDLQELKIENGKLKIIGLAQLCRCVVMTVAYDDYF